MKILATLLSTAVLSFSVAADAFSQTDDAGRALTNDTGRALVVSNVLKLSADTERSSPVATPPKQFIVPFAGIVRVRWQFRSDGAVRSNISSNIGGCSSSTSSATYVQRVCDLRVVAGDRIEAVALADPVYATSIASIKNVRVYYNVVNNPGTGKTLVN